MVSISGTTETIAASGSTLTFATSGGTVNTYHIVNNDITINSLEVKL